MNACIVCSYDVLRSISMTDKERLAIGAREFIRGMISGRRNSKDLQLPPRPRPGTCIVERCAQLIEGPCGGCRDCARCAIAAELRAAEDRINAERDAELDAAELEDRDLEGAVDNLVAGICADHAPFGSALAGQWYGRNSFSVAQPIADDRGS